MYRYTKPSRAWTFKDIRDWYSRADVKFEIIKQTFKRETAFLVPKFIEDEDMSRSSVRMLKIHNVPHLEVSIKATRMMEREVPYNMYFSLARYFDGIPNQHLNFATRDNTSWNHEHFKSMSWFDMLIDIDCGIDNIDYGWSSVMDMAKYFDALSVPYSVRFSGGGFHIVIPGQYFPRNTSFDPKDANNIYKMQIKIAKHLYEHRTELIDLSIYDSRRIAKIPYSLAVYKDDIFVCHPFNSIEELRAFNPNDLRIWDYPHEIRNRGVKVFNDFGNLAELFKEVGL